MYSQNYYLINPAAVGLNGCWEAFTNNRRQWAGISNAPKQGYLSANGAIDKSQGVGSCDRLVNFLFRR